MAQLLALFLILLSTFSAQAAGFLSGNQFQAIPIYGFLNMTCASGIDTRRVTFQCQDVRLSPADWDYFVGPRVPADHVALSALHADGSTTVKSVGYDGGEGRSTEKFNLWVQTLFQDPLLQEGTNTISYRILRGGDSVLEGNFQVAVPRGQSRRCSTGQTQSDRLADCDNQYSACQKYFNQHNECF